MNEEANEIFIENSKIVVTENRWFSRRDTVALTTRETIDRTKENCENYIISIKYINLSSFNLRLSNFL